MTRVYKRREIDTVGGVGGGGVLAQASNVTLRGGFVSGNAAEADGGGLLVEAGARVVVEGVTFADNAARGDGDTPAASRAWL